MKVITRYVCELCDTEFNTESEARACEAHGLPEPMPFLPWDVEIPAFGENGVEWIKLHSVHVEERFGGHRWALITSPSVHLSHNADPESPLIPASAFDPRRGWDAFRYECTPADLATWKKAMSDYGFEESEANEFIRTNIQRYTKTASVSPVGNPDP